MSEGRRWRVRRKRKQDSALDGIDGQVVDTIGCCLFELVVSSAFLIGLLLLPTWLLLH